MFEDLYQSSKHELLSSLDRLCRRFPMVKTEHLYTLPTNSQPYQPSPHVIEKVNRLPSWPQYDYNCWGSYSIH